MRSANLLLYLSHYVVVIFFMRRGHGMKIILWIIAIIFIVGLLTITGVFKLIF